MTQKSENLIKNACYSKQMIIFANRITSVLCWCRNLRLMALCSFPNRYLFSLHSKVTSLFSIRYILEIIFPCSGMNVLSWWNTSTITRVFPHFVNIVFRLKIWIYTVTTPLEYCWMMGCYVLVCCCVVIFLLRNQKATGYIFPINDYLSDTNISE